MSITLYITRKWKKHLWQGPWPTVIWPTYLHSVGGSCSQRHFLLGFLWLIRPYPGPRNGHWRHTKSPHLDALWHHNTQIHQSVRAQHILKIHWPNSSLITYTPCMSHLAPQSQRHRLLHLQRRHHFFLSRAIPVVVLFTNKAYSKFIFISLAVQSIYHNVLCDKNNDKKVHDVTIGTLGNWWYS